MVMFKTIKWLNENSEVLQEKYSGRYIAVQNEAVIAVGETISEVNSKAKLVSKGDPYIIEFVERGDLHAYSITFSNEENHT